MKYLFLFLFSFLFLNLTSAQTQLIHVDVGIDTLESNYNVNSKHYTYPHFSTAYPIGKYSANVLNLRSPVFDLGINYKYKFSGAFSMIHGLSFEMLNAKIHQDHLLTNSAPPLSLKKARENIRRYSFKYTFAFRTNFDVNRGQMPGTYLDLGVQPGTYFRSVYFYRYTFEEGDRANTKFRNSENWNPVYLRFMARLGAGRSALKATWQYTPHYKGSVTYPEMPYFLIGFEFNWM